MTFVYEPYPETLEVMREKTPKRFREVLMSSDISTPFVRGRRKHPKPYERPHRSERLRDEELQLN